MAEQFWFRVLMKLFRLKLFAFLWFFGRAGNRTDDLIDSHQSILPVCSALALVIETIFISYSGIYAVIRVDFIPTDMLHFNNSFVGAK